MLVEAILRYAGILDNFSIFLNAQSQWLSGMVLLPQPWASVSLWSTGSQKLFSFSLFNNNNNKPNFFLPWLDLSFGFPVQMSF